ncbi:hypothetical protein MMC18_003515 [Xylographa bjoerkii]|nr:hypothetical protein [Xylographa bjoerkii]
MLRYPTPSPESLTDHQRTLEPAVVKQMFSNFPQLSYKDKDGNLLGPYSSLHYTPELIDPWFGLAGAVVGQARFSVKEREISILAVLAAYDAPFVLYAHSEIAVVCGLSKEQVQQAIDGKVPVGLSEQEAMVYELSLKLASFRGPLDRESFNRAENVLGKAKIAGLAHLVTGYIHVAMLTNIGDGAVPEPKEGVFLAKKGNNVV